MKLRILIVDDERPARHGMRKALESVDYEVIEASGGREALTAIQEQAPDLVFLDLTMPDLTGQDVLVHLGEHRPGVLEEMEVIVVTGDDRVATAVECLRLGAANYVAKPYEVEQLRAIARRALQRLQIRQRVDELETDRAGDRRFGLLIGAGPPMRALYELIQRAAAAPLDVLIVGETGVGKELVAREIHRRSSRAAGPFVAVNTAAIADSLAESELFGHVKGAFTGADRDRMGVFQQADGGTLFLDEIGDMPLPAQAKILRALQQRSIQRVGDPGEISIDVRVVSATHQDLEDAIAAQQFRQDLYFRIKGVRIDVPPLRRRREDILLLAEHFLHDSGVVDAPLSTAACDRLLHYNWPGNVRELEQVVRAAAALATGQISPNDLQIGDSREPDEAWDWEEYLSLPLTEGKSKLVEDFERAAISRAIAATDGNISAAARRLGIHRQNLQQKLKQLDIQH